LHRQQQQRTAHLQVRTGTSSCATCVRQQVLCLCCCTLLCCSVHISQQSRYARARCLVAQLWCSVQHC
jgi:hypothetical protein